MSTEFSQQGQNVDKKLSKMALDSKNLVTQKENLFHFQEEIWKMDACVMFEETSLKDFKTATKKHGRDSNLVALSNAVRKARSGVSCSTFAPIFYISQLQLRANFEN